MGASKSVIQVFEHQTLKVDGKYPEFKSAHFRALEQYGYKTKEKYFTVGNKRIKFNNYVGVLQVKNLTIEVLPKADNANDDEDSKVKWQAALIGMLKECKLIKLNAILNAKLKLKSASILDLYYELFLTETETLNKHGLRKKYRREQANLNKVKGKILFTQHIRKNVLHKERFFVEHSRFDKDNKLNQILLKALLILRDIATDSNQIIRSNKLLLAFEGISKKEITGKWFENLRFGRNTERYRQAITLAKLIILRYAPDLKGGGENVLAIMFDMNMLFEEYIFRKLKAVQLQSNEVPLRISRQNRIPFWQSRGLKADIVVEMGGERLVIDTKWKILTTASPSDADLKQMFVYNLHYDTDLSILLYPKTNIESVEKKAFHRFNELNCQIAFVDLFDENGKLDKAVGAHLYKDLLSSELKQETLT